MSLYIGANYHPHDWPAKRWETDVEMMKRDIMILDAFDADLFVQE